MKLRWKIALAGLLSVTLGMGSAGAADGVSANISDTSYGTIGEEALAAAACGAQKACKVDLEACCEGDIVPYELFPETCSGLKIGGWTQIGYHSDDSLAGAPVAADLFNQYEDRVALHQQWLYAEKVADGSCGWDWGFRADFMYGIDANNTQAFGNNYGQWDYSDSFNHGNYGFAIPQAYAEVANGDLSVKVGHFYTLIGYEVVTAPDNFFYSHAFTMNNSEPFTHTGVLATYGVSDKLTVYAGWTLGWDTGFDQFENGNNWLGGFSYSLIDGMDLIYISTAGDFGLLGKDAYSHSIVLDVDVTEKLNYVFQSDLLHIGEVNAQTIGINQYLFYTLNDCWSFGARAEWYHTDAAGPAGSVNGATFGVNYRPHTNLVIRPEIKQEWVPSQLFGPRYDTAIFGIDMVLTY